MSQVFQCHFIKAAIFEINLSIHSSQADWKYDTFIEQFPHLDPDKNSFFTYVKRFNRSCRERRISTAMKKFQMEHFSFEKWNKLDINSRRLHGLHECNPCKNLLFDSGKKPTQSLPVSTLPTSTFIEPTISSSHLSTPNSFPALSTPISLPIVSPSSTMQSQPMSYITTPTTSSTTPLSASLISVGI